MIFILIVCTQVYGGVQCLPPVEYSSRARCEFIARHYYHSAQKASGYEQTKISDVRCLGMKK